MSTTIRVSNGQIDIDPSTGQLVSITGERKCAQDMAECLMQDYYPDQNYGSYLRQIIQNPFPGAGEILVRHYVAEAIKLLDNLQSADPAITSDEKITDILELNTASNSSGLAAFYVRVGTEDGGSSVNITTLRPTQLNQQNEGL